MQKDNYNETIELTRQALHSNSYWMVNKKIARELGFDTALFLSELISWESYLENNNMLKKDRYFFHTTEHLKKSIGFSQYQTRKSTKKLSSNNIIETKREGHLNRSFYRINHNQLLKILTSSGKIFLPHNNNILNNNELDIPKGISTGAEAPVRSYNNTSLDVGEKKMVRTRWLPEQRYGEDFLSLVRLWNHVKGAGKHSMDRDSKTLQKANKYVKQLVAGTFCRANTNVTIDWMIKNGIPKEWLTKKWTIDEIRSGIKLMRLQFLPGYWPFTEQEKKKLPRSLEGSLYNPFNGCPSVFLKVMANPPVKKSEAIPPIKDQRIVKLYLKEYLKVDIEKLSVSERQQLAKQANAIFDFHQERAEELNEIYGNTSMSTYFGRKKDPYVLAKTFVNWLLNKGRIYNNGEPFHSDFRPEVSHLRCDPKSSRWRRFVADFKAVHGYNVDPTEDELKKLRRMYRKNEI